MLFSSIKEPFSFVIKKKKKQIGFRRMGLLRYQISCTLLSYSDASRFPNLYSHQESKHYHSIQESRVSYKDKAFFFLLHILPVVKYASIQSYQYIHGEATILFYFLDTTRKPPSDSLSGSDML